MNMIRHIYLLAAAALSGLGAILLFGSPIRSTTHDVAFTFRMGAGSPGDVNRTHPASIISGLINTTTPPRYYGDFVLNDATTNSYKGVVAGDGSATALKFAGVAVRPFPTQQNSGGMSSPLGEAAAPTSGVLDVLDDGFIMVKIPAGVTVAKGGTVYVWCAASTGNHVQGRCEGAASSTNTVPVANAYFTGPADANGVVEVRVTA